MTNKATAAPVIKIRVDLEHPNFPDTHAIVEHKGELNEFAYADLAKAGRKAAASRHVSYESFAGDSAYLDALDNAAELYTATSIRRTDGEDKAARFYVRADYSSDEAGDWIDHVTAVDDDEARFIAMQICADNERADRTDPDAFQSSMEDITIRECYPEPFTKDELEAFVRRIAGFTVTQDGPDSIDVVNRLRSEALALLGLPDVAEIEEAE